MVSFKYDLQTTEYELRLVKVLSQVAKKVVRCDEVSDISDRIPRRHT